MNKTKQTNKVMNRKSVNKPNATSKLKVKATATRVNGTEGYRKVANNIYTFPNTDGYCVRKMINGVKYSKNGCRTIKEAKAFISTLA